MNDLKLLFMFFLSLVSGAAMYVILFRFLRQLKRIEDEYWGRKPEKTPPA